VRAALISTLASVGAIALLVTGCSGAEPGTEKASPTDGVTPARSRPLERQPPDKAPGPALPRISRREPTFALRTVLSDLEAPTQVVSRPGDPRLYVAEQRGTVRIVTDGRLEPKPYLDLRDRVRSGGELGLLSIVFTENGRRLTAHYTDRDANTRVVAFAAGRQAARRSTARRLLGVIQPYENHKGGQLVADGRGRLLLGLGDGGSAFDRDERAQASLSRLGKLLRYDPRRPRAGWEQIGIGLRNPWRMALDPGTGLLFIGDVGQDRVEEVNAVRVPGPGGRVLNFGWSAYEGNLPLGRKPLARRGRLVWPVAGYPHNPGCSVTGGVVYRGRGVRRLRGRYLFGDLCSGTLYSLRAARALSPDRIDLRREAARLQGVTSFGTDARGEVHATSADGRLVRLVARIPDGGGMDYSGAR